MWLIKVLIAEQILAAQALAEEAGSRAAISWRYCKQTLVATSTNHSELLALYEATRECVWLRAVISHIRSTCDLAYDPNEPVIIYEDNISVIDQAKHGYIKGDNTKHISPKLFFTHEQQAFQKIEVQHIGSDKNHADLFTKSLPKWVEEVVRSSWMGPMLGVDKLRVMSDEGIDESRQLRILALLELRNTGNLSQLDLAQKAKVNWDIEGDDNSGFFHWTLNRKRSWLLWVL
ncbi:hypothetical protein LXL04_005425 [Taraxacum kok-saghyz]